MKTEKSGRLALVLAVGGLMALAPSAVSSQGLATEATRAGIFHWSGECRIRYPDGRCLWYRTADVVRASDAIDARRKAAAEFLARAKSQGMVIEETIRVTVDLFESIDQAEPRGSAAAIAVKPWSAPLRPGVRPPPRGGTSRSQGRRKALLAGTGRLDPRPSRHPDVTPVLSKCNEKPEGVQCHEIHTTCVPDPAVRLLHDRGLDRPRR